MMSVYKNKLVFITGGSTGIGFSIAKAFYQQGSRVVLFARSVPKLDKAIQEIKEIYKEATQSVSYYSVDMSSYPSVKTIMDKAVLETGVPDILINCVGIAQPDYFENITPERFDTTIKTNLYSTWNAVHTLVPYMKTKGGVIVNTSSIAGFLGVFGYTDYCMTKFGIIGFSEALRSELKQHHIKVQVLCPPDTDTPGFEAENATKPEETKAIGGKAKLLHPDFVAKVVLNDMFRNNFFIIPGFDGKLTRLIKRFFPWLIDWVMNSSIKKVQNKNNV